MVFLEGRRVMTDESGLVLKEKIPLGSKRVVDLSAVKNSCADFAFVVPGVTAAVLLSERVADLATSENWTGVLLTYRSQDGKMNL